MDRAGLFAEVAKELNRQDKLEFLPSWLTSTEFRVNQLLRDRRMIERAILRVDTNEFPVPDDFLETESLSIQDGSLFPAFGAKASGALFYTPPDQLDSDPKAFVTESPHWFTVRGRYMELAGWRVSTPFQVRLFYYAELRPLLNDDSTNWLLEKAPHIYRHGMLHFGFQHLEEYDVANNFLTTMVTEIQGINEIAKATKHGNGPLIMRPSQKLGGRHS